MFYSLKIKQYLVLFALFLAGYLFTICQKYFIPEFLRPFTLFVVVLAILLIFFLYVKPVMPNRLTKSLSLILGIAATMIIIVQDVLIMHHLTYKAAIVLVVSIISPFISGKIYQMIKTKELVQNNSKR